MTRYYLRLVILPFLVIALGLLLVRAQPYDDHELRELLLPEGCPMPCFMGIRPGITAVDEAIKILETSNWVDKIDYRPGDRIMQVTWSSNAPFWLANREGRRSSFISINDDVVAEFQFDTNITLADIQLTLGASFHQK